MLTLHGGMFYFSVGACLANIVLIALDCVVLSIL